MSGASGTNRLGGLDSLRFFAALWVMMRHGAMPPLTEGAGDGNLTQTIDWAWRGAISGPAAVICFFVISGLCIHLPYANGKRFDLGEYALRRFVRLTLPMLAAVVLWRLFHGMDDFSKDWLAGIPAWSIVAELIYYFLYPLLRRVPGNPWKTMFLVTFAAGFALAILTQPRSNINYPAWGYSVNWILGLPVWILGVVLAEWKSPLPSPSAWRIWSERLVAVGLGAATTYLAWQRVAGHHLTLNLVALYAAWWIRDELGYHRAHAPIRLLEWGGTWSYSLYLVHTIAFAVYRRMALPFFGHLADWILKMAFVLVLAYVFHVLVERPSHRLAQRLARSWIGRRTGGGSGRAERIPIVSA